MLTPSKKNTQGVYVMWANLFWNIKSETPDKMASGAVIFWRGDDTEYTVTAHLVNVNVI